MVVVLFDYVLYCVGSFLCFFVWVVGCDGVVYVVDGVYVCK